MCSSATPPTLPCPKCSPTTPTVGLGIALRRPLGPDELAAAGLDQAAERASRRGALEVALAAQQRAAELSETAARRGHRLLAAAEMAFELGRLELGLSLVRAR